MPTRIVDAWNGWYHINGNTYGTWIRGDRRGWRARHHREHVEGDYKNPPAEKAHERERNLSLRLMDDAILLDLRARQVACDAMVASLEHQKIETIALAVDDHHFHLLARFRLPRPTDSSPWASSRTRNQPIYAYIRHVIGLAKSSSAMAMSESGLLPRGGVWAKRCKITAIADREHQVSVFYYILRHGKKGAHVWSLRGIRGDH